MRPGPPNSVVDYDYFLDIWTAVTFLISLVIRDQLMTHRGPRIQSGKPCSLSRISPSFSIIQTLPRKQMKQKIIQRMWRSPEDALSRNKDINNYKYLLFCQKLLLLYPSVFNQAECKITSWLVVQFYRNIAPEHSACSKIKIYSLAGGLKVAHHHIRVLIKMFIQS